MVVLKLVNCMVSLMRRDHLFITCPYSFAVWLKISDFLSVTSNPDWEETLQHLVSHRFNRLDYILIRLAFQMTIYYL